MEQDQRQKSEGGGDGVKDSSKSNRLACRGLGGDDYDPTDGSVRRSAEGEFLLRRSTRVRT